MKLKWSPSSSKAAVELSKALRCHRRQLAQAFADALANTPKWRLVMQARRGQWDSFLESEFFTFVDYLAQYFGRGDDTYYQLFIGEKIKSLYDPTLSEAERQLQTKSVGERELSGMEQVLKAEVSTPAWQLLVSNLEEIQSALLPKNVKIQRVLLVGDCLFLDIIPFVAGDLMQAGISVVPDYATSKNPLELRDQLRQLDSKKFDLVFYSPFSYEFSPEYTQLANWRSALVTGQYVRSAAEKAWGDACSTLDLMADLFDCPIHVHNSSAVIREESVVKRFVKLNVTRRVRNLAKKHVNALLNEYIAQKNRATYKHLFVVDEARLVGAAGEMRAGAFLYRTALQHPACLGQIVSKSYVDTIFVNAHLSTKKLIVCDLDNTLWDGVIGEGVVTHYHSRQQTLKDLKRKGVVLAINSKNDPANVHWRGGTLSYSDFVFAAISWDPKVQGMKRIQADLNLKAKDFVFIDDREDELNLMHSSYPDVLCLNATHPNTWARFELWRTVLEDDMEMDRTAMYQQREQRKAFVIEDASNQEEKVVLFRSLQLRLTIAHAQAGDLKRVTELINRTNQFNLEGSRTSYKEVSQWHATENHWIVIGQTADRFGDMGTTCVAVVEKRGEDMRLLPFVLSCRVFGYGIETAVLGYLESLAIVQGVRRIVGRYTPTAQNTPCKEFLSNSGFKSDGDVCVFAIGEARIPTVDWLQIEQPQTATRR